MWKDPIVEEVRKNRDRIAKKKGYSLRKIFQSVQKSASKNTKNSKRFAVKVK